MASEPEDLNTETTEHLRDLRVESWLPNENTELRPLELRRIQRMLKDSESLILEKWNARFGD